MQPAVVGRTVQFAEAHRALRLNLEAPEHEFWPLDVSLGAMLPEIQQRIRGPQQLTDAILLDLAIRRRGRLVTFDRRIENLLPSHSPHQAALEVIGPFDPAA